MSHLLSDHTLVMTPSHMITKRSFYFGTPCEHRVGYLAFDESMEPSENAQHNVTKNGTREAMKKFLMDESIDCSEEIAEVQKYLDEIDRLMEISEKKRDFYAMLPEMFGRWTDIKKNGMDRFLNDEMHSSGQELLDKYSRII